MSNTETTKELGDILSSVDELCLPLARIRDDIIASFYLNRKSDPEMSFQGWSETLAGAPVPIAARDIQNAINHLAEAVKILNKAHPATTNAKQ
jgi:hypothetical protein